MSNSARRNNTLLHRSLWWTVIGCAWILDSNFHLVHAEVSVTRRRGVRGERFLEDTHPVDPKTTEAPTATPQQSPAKNPTPEGNQHNVCRDAQDCLECQTQALYQEHYSAMEKTCRWHMPEGKPPDCRQVLQNVAVKFENMCDEASPQSVPPTKAPVGTTPGASPNGKETPSTPPPTKTPVEAPTSSPSGKENPPSSPSPSTRLTASPTKKNPPPAKNDSPTAKPTQLGPQPTKAPVTQAPTKQPAKEPASSPPTKAPIGDGTPVETSPPTALSQPGPPAEDTPTTASPTTSPTKAPTKSFNNEQDYYDTEGSAFDSFGSKEAAGITILVVLAFLWTKCCRSSNNNTNGDTKSGIPTRLSPNASIFGQRNNEAQYQGIATKEEVDDDENADDWGWDDEDNNDTFAGDMEMSNVGAIRKASTPPSYNKSSPTQSSSPAFAHKPATGGFNNSRTSPGRMVAGGGGGVRPTIATSSSSPMKTASLPTYAKQTTPPKKPPAPKADDIFSEMGLSAKPTFGKKSLGATKLPVDDSWGDDDDLDDLLND